jgi:hypothetical protein
MLIKVLLLKEYRIEFHGISAAIIGALVVAKVLLVLEKIPLGSLTRSQPAFLEVMVRTLIYVAGVFVVLVIEHAFRGRGEYGGFLPSLRHVFAHVDVYHLYVNTLCVTGAILGFNVLSVLRRHHGEGGLFRLFFASRGNA